MYINNGCGSPLVTAVHRWIFVKLSWRSRHEILNNPRTIRTIRKKSSKFRFALRSFWMLTCLSGQFWEAEETTVSPLLLPLPCPHLPFGGASGERIKCRQSASCFLSALVESVISQINVACPCGHCASPSRQIRFEHVLLANIVSIIPDLNQLEGFGHMGHVVQSLPGRVEKESVQTQILLLWTVNGCIKTGCLSTQNVCFWSLPELSLIFPANLLARPNYPSLSSHYLPNPWVMERRQSPQNRLFAQKIKLKRFYHPIKKSQNIKK